jgi:7-cyano-7-deazaguanine tRNA-ribosyltransferase
MCFGVFYISVLTVLVQGVKMSFEIREKDLLARVGKLRTKTGAVETPLLLPVINPSAQLVPAREIRNRFGFEALIANAYIIRQRFREEPVKKGLHGFLGFDGVAMTDSGAYQILVYGDIQADQTDIVKYQEKIGSDIATILDIPTGWKVTEKQAEQTVKETLKRARQFFKIKSRGDILWVGPVQGGKHLNLVCKSAKDMSKLPFDIYALGSPTEVMESYRFDVLVDMILTAKMNLPLGRPLHLFGAGHPFMFSLAVACGCDMFDSAAYALFARDGRYMTENGTHRLDELEFFPCSCPKCTHAAPKQVLELPAKEREVFLAEHNLYVCAAEIRRIKQAIRDGRLWEHMEMRAHSHPALYTAARRLAKYKDYIEKHSPSTKPSGLFFCNSLSLIRPEVIRHSRLLAERYTPPKQAKTLLLMPQTGTKPFHRSREYKQMQNDFRQEMAKASVCFYSAPFGIVPIELDEVYPLSQHEAAMPLDKETREHVAEQTANHIERTKPRTVMLVHDFQNWNNIILKTVKKTCKREQIDLKILRIANLKNTEDRKRIRQASTPANTHVSREQPHGTNSRTNNRSICQERPKPHPEGHVGPK